jgi:hypothetical protein
MRNVKRLQTPLAGLAFLAGLLPACGSDDSPGRFEPARETKGPPDAPPHATQTPLPPAGDEGLGLEWKLPAGWSELPASPYRQANFRLPGETKAECYLSLLPGEVGGLAANITRWRTQLALPPLPPGEIANLPHAQLLGRDGVVVDFSGTWKGMAGTENEPNWRLVGVLQVSPTGSAFFKMYGPDALIAAEKDNFLALASSIRPAHAHLDSAPPPMSPADPAVASMAGDQQGLVWMAPGTWTKAADKPQRTVTYQTSTGAECYVTVMGGEAGGIAGNVTRWRDQMGCAAPTGEELEKLEHLPMLGGDGRLVAIEGIGKAAGKGLLGALVQAGGRMVFVKLTGPIDAVGKETGNFKAFAQSLKEAPK